MLGFGNGNQIIFVFSRFQHRLLKSESSYNYRHVVSRRVPVLKIFFNIFTCVLFINDNPSIRLKTFRWVWGFDRNIFCFDRHHHSLLAYHLASKLCDRFAMFGGIFCEIIIHIIRTIAFKSAAWAF